MLAPLGLALLLVAVVASCARMGQPDGGWYDETPPKVIGATPADRGVNVSAKKVNIFFDEYIKIENPSEKVVVSPPQLEQPEIKAAGKRIEVKLADSLKANTTYTIDFSDALPTTTRATRWATTPTASPPVRRSTRSRWRARCCKPTTWSR